MREREARSGDDGRRGSDRAPAALSKLLTVLINGAAEGDRELLEVLRRDVLSGASARSLRDAGVVSFEHGFVLTLRNGKRFVVRISPA
ncbi:hypothetical protein RAS1_32730 [Phycisphaerae bacterium RAS1]|nr:hypothetical protein RAS1_32730 [Phycisphaerae bacterium RAS1]